MISVGLLMASVLVLSASELLALFHPDPGINSVSQFVSRRILRLRRPATVTTGVGLMVMLALGVCLRAMSVEHQTREQRCVLDNRLKTSFAGMWNGHSVILRVERYEAADGEGRFDYAIKIDGDQEFHGHGAASANSCEVLLSTFDSRGRLFYDGNRWGFESIEPAWRLTSATRANAGAAR